jgi:hypothetical protein
MATVSPKILMLLGGNSEPAYLIKITALVSEIAPTKKKCSTALMQKFMLASLDISPDEESSTSNRSPKETSLQMARLRFKRLREWEGTLMETVEF